MDATSRGNSNSDTRLRAARHRRQTRMLLLLLLLRKQWRGGAFCSFNSASQQLCPATDECISNVKNFDKIGPNGGFGGTWIRKLNVRSGGRQRGQGGQRAKARGAAAAALSDGESETVSNSVCNRKMVAILGHFEGTHGRKLGQTKHRSFRVSSSTLFRFSFVVNLAQQQP